MLNAQTYWKYFQHFTLGEVKISEEASSGGEKVPTTEPQQMVIEQVELATAKPVVELFDFNIGGVLYDSTNFFTFPEGGCGFPPGLPTGSHTRGISVCP